MGPCRVRVHPRGIAALRSGRPWVYRGDVAAVDGDPGPGEVVLLSDTQGRPVGQAFYHHRSVLAARLLTADPDAPIDAEFFRRRLRRAVAYRAALGASACRLVFAEADGLPGLIVDRLADLLVVQVTAAGIELRLDLICDALIEITGLDRIFERNDAAVRRLEELPARVGALRGAPPERVTVSEGRVRMEVDVRHGGKTGHFLDQRDNRALFGDLVARLLARAPDTDMISSPAAYGLDRGAPAAGGTEVLDAFCHTGGFGLQALSAGAARATFVESSPVAAAGVRRNLEVNGFGGGSVLEGNAFDILRDLESQGARFGAIVLDPPAFARSRRQLDGAYRGYKDINLRAMRLLQSDGLLCTSSCSQPVTEEMFAGMLTDAASDAGRRMRVIARRGPGPDHPALLGADDTAYLQCWFLQAVD